MAENPTAGLTQEEEEENIDYDSDGNPIASTTKKIIMPLPPIDHSEVEFTTLIKHSQLKSAFYVFVMCKIVVIFAACFVLFFID